MTVAVVTVHVMCPIVVCDCLNDVVTPPGLHMMLQYCKHNYYNIIILIYYTDMCKTTYETWSDILSGHDKICADIIRIIRTLSYNYKFQ